MQFPLVSESSPRKGFVCIVLKLVTFRDNRLTEWDLAPFSSNDCTCRIIFTTCLWWTRRARSRATSKRSSPSASSSTRPSTSRSSTLTSSASSSSDFGLQLKSVDSRFPFLWKWCHQCNWQYQPFRRQKCFDCSTFSGQLLHIVSALESSRLTVSSFISKWANLALQ